MAGFIFADDMRYNIIDIRKYRKSLFSLNELVRKYGGNEILEYDEEEPLGCPETVCVVVTRIMEDLGLEYLIEWKNWWKIWKHHRDDLTIEQLTVIIYHAMAEFKQNYLDVMAPDNASDENKLVKMRSSLEKDREFIRRLNHDSGEIPEAYDYSITPEDMKKGDRLLTIDFGRSLLKEIGVKAISTTEDVDMLLWRMAFMGYYMTRGFRNAMVELTNSCEFIDFIDFRCRQFNHVLGNQKEKRGNYLLKELKKKNKEAHEIIMDLKNKLKSVSKLSEDGSQ